MSDSMANGRFGISDYDQLEDESFPPLPPPHSPGHGADDENPFGEEDGDLSKLADVPAAKRKVVRKPQPKLDSQRLISERGLPALRTLFNNVHFKGKGHEAEDLRVIMQKMENWAHRLYPKLQFDDFMDKVERLGSKKDVQTCLKRIRLDLPLIHDDFISKDVEEEMTPVQQIFGDPDPFGSPRGFPGNSQGPVHSTPAPAHSTPALTLTEEQRRRIELNKQLALEKRLARQQQPIVLDIVPDPQVVSSQAVSPQADSSKADSSKAVPSQADSSKAVSSQADSSQADSSKAVSSQADSSHDVPSQADSSQVISSQASPVHQPPASLPQSEPCPPEPGLEDMDMDVDPSTEHPDNATARDSPASLASPKHKEGELSQPGS